MAQKYIKKSRIIYFEAKLFQIIIYVKKKLKKNLKKSSIYDFCHVLKLIPYLILPTLKQQQTLINRLNINYYEKIQVF